MSPSHGEPDVTPGAVSRPTLVAAPVAAAALLIIYIPAFAHAVDVWRLDEEFSFGFAVPFLALGLAWLRRASIVASLGRGSAWGLPILVAGLVMLVIGARTGVHIIGGASFVVSALGAVTYLFGLRALRATFFPIAFLLFGLTLYRGLLNTLGFGLQNLTATSSASLATRIGVPVHRDGVDLFVGQFHLVVAQACSGMSSLLTLLCLGTLMIGLAQSTLPRRLLLLLLIVPIVLVANIVRVTLVLALVRPFGLTVVEGFVHGSFSAVLFLMAIGLFLIAGRLLKCYPRLDALAL